MRWIKELFTSRNSNSTTKKTFSANMNHKIPQDPAGISKMDDQMNAIANVMIYTQKGWIKMIYENNYPVGIWCKHFPENTTKRSFLSMFCTLVKRESKNPYIEDLQICILAQKYRISPSREGNGFDIYIADV